MTTKTIVKRELSVGAHPYSKKICLSLTEYFAEGGAVTMILARFDSKECADTFLGIINGEEGDEGVWHDVER